MQKVARSAQHCCRSSLLCACAGYSVLQGPTTGMVRPHPAVWRLVHGVMVIYLLILIFMLFQDVGDARQLLKVQCPALQREAFECMALDVNRLCQQDPCSIPRSEFYQCSIQEALSHQAEQKECPSASPACAKVMMQKACMPSSSLLAMPVQLSSKRTLSNLMLTAQSGVLQLPPGLLSLIWWSSTRFRCTSTLLNYAGCHCHQSCSPPCFSQS